jgi:hypothetical protein
LTASASLYAQSNVGIEAGWIQNNLATAHVDVKPGASFRIGGFVNYRMMDYDGWGAGIYYVRKSAKLSDFLPQYAAYLQKIDYSADYVELVPVTLRFNTLFSGDPQKLKIVPVLSLYAAYGFSGKATLTGSSGNDPVFSKKIDNVFKDNRFTENNTDYDFKAFKPYDMGGKIGIDFVYNQFILRMNWTRGIGISSYDKRMKNNSIDLSFCYLFK